MSPFTDTTLNERMYTETTTVHSISSGSYTIITNAIIYENLGDFLN